MGTVPKKTEEEIYHAALVKSAAERSAFLEEACAGDPGLLCRMKTLLVSREQAGNFLLAPPLDLDIALEDTGLAEGPGTVIGRYRLLDKIGEGGMAVVYMAEQERPMRRKVALKIIKVGMDTEQVIARFEAERQALALMDHPHIAKVLDAGSTETGRPYFVMELVKGQSITQYCNQHRMSTHERLALFTQVCSAVQHAHQKGIIHRDIKPANVMVTQGDGGPVPKIIDFGIAKATNQRLTEKTLFTRYAQIIGTPAYMSPEQAELSELDVDTRSDIYSLGILLYELLTGTTPFSDEHLRKAGYLEMLRIIREREPGKPSTKLSTLGNTVSSVAAERGATLEILQRQLRGDLDWIVLKALEKKRNRRYDAVSALALDIQHYLSQEPVSARAPRFSYILGKYLCKHRSRLATSAIVITLLAAVVTISLMWNDNRWRLWEAAKVTEQATLSQARDAFAQRDLETALQHTQSILNSAHVGAEARLLYAGILVDGMQPEEAVLKLQDLLTESPEIAGTAHALLARVYLEGDFEESEKQVKVKEHQQKAEELGPDTAEANLLRAMAALTIRQKFQFLNDALRLDPRHYESYRLRAYTYYASRKYEQMRIDALVMVALRPQDLLGYSLRAKALRELGSYDEAIADYRAAIEKTPAQDVQRVKLHEECCEAYFRLGEYKAGIALARECSAHFPDEIVLHFRILCALTALGDYRLAGQCYTQIAARAPEAQRKFGGWARRYVFDTLDAGQPWHPAHNRPEGILFQPMREAERLYEHLSARASRTIVDSFRACWSPDGTKLAFSMGFIGSSGLAIYDSVTGETDLLIVPGKDPAWSPDGRRIAFVRDCKALSLPELTGAKRERQARDITKEELWIINSDGTEPRPLALGSWPSWSQDPGHLYYVSDVDSMLYLRSIDDDDAPPQPILSCSNNLPMASPDGKYVAYCNRREMRIVELASESVVAEWSAPLDIVAWGVGGWSPTGRMLSIGTNQLGGRKEGLWLYDLDKRQASKVLDGTVSSASWSSDGAKLVFELGSPFFDVWTLDLDASTSAISALGPARSVEDHYQEMASYYTRNIEADPADADSYFFRAGYRWYLHDANGCHADMAKYAALNASNQEPVGVYFGTPENLGMAINTPAEEGHPLPVLDELSLVFYRRNGEGRNEYWRSSRETPDSPWQTAEKLPSANKVVIPGTTTADGLERYVSQRPGEYGTGDVCVRKRKSKGADWGDPIDLAPAVKRSSRQVSPAISPDGLELYFSGIDDETAGRSGQGGADLWVARRKNREAEWTEPVNLGPNINSQYSDCRPSLCADGLILLFDSTRPGGQGSFDLWMMRRSSLNGPWGEAINLGPGVNTPAAECCPHLSADGSTLYYESDRPGSHGHYDIWQVPIVIPELTDSRVDRAHPKDDKANNKYR